MYVLKWSIKKNPNRSGKYRRFVYRFYIKKYFFLFKLIFHEENQNHRNGKVFFSSTVLFFQNFFSLSILWSVAASLSTTCIGRSSRVNVACRYVPTVYTNRPWKIEPLAHTCTRECLCRYFLFYFIFFFILSLSAWREDTSYLEHEDHRQKRRRRRRIITTAMMKKKPIYIYIYNLWP